MANVVGVQVKKIGKVFYFYPGELKLNLGDNVIVETIRGIEYGTVTVLNREINPEKFKGEIKTVIRIATEEDDKKNAENIKKEKEAVSICLKKIQEHNLGMKLIDAQYTFDNNRLLFYFTAEGRIDFRELVKDLASIFRTRIELRQIGVRDETKIMDGIGVCGKRYCCTSYLNDFVPVSIKMAKEQKLSLNPIKISGCCGRLMCCLKYEQNVYEDKLKKLPKVGAIVETVDGQGVVVDVNILKETVNVKIDNSGDIAKEYDNKKIKVIKNVGKSVDNVTADDIEEGSIEELKKLED